jgi:Tol biopolymer transport system component
MFHYALLYLPNVNNFTVANCNSARRTGIAVRTARGRPPYRPSRLSWARGLVAFVGILILLLLAACSPESNSAPPAVSEASEQSDEASRALLAPASPVEKIAYISDRTGNREIWLLNVKDGSSRQLTSDPTTNANWPRISPDGKRILYYRAAPGDDVYIDGELWLMNIDGTQQRVLRPRGMDGWEIQGHAEWSPNGSQLVMAGGRGINPQIYVTDSEGRNPRALTSRGGMNVDPSWSPDGRTIVFVACSSFVCFHKDLEIFTMTASGEQLRQLTSNELRDHDPYFSPDGRTIAWIRETEPGVLVPGVLGVWNIIMMNADGTKEHPLTKDRQVNSVPQWSRDGSTIYFHRYEVKPNGAWGLYSIRPDGTELRPLPLDPTGNNEFPSPSS